MLFPRALAEPVPQQAGDQHRRSQVHEALARQRGFVADASHELRTPLAVLGTELELAGRPGRSRQEPAQAVASAEDEVARLTRLTNDLLVLAGSDEGGVPVRLTPTDLRAVLERCTERAAVGRRRPESAW